MADPQKQAPDQPQASKAASLLLWSLLCGLAAFAVSVLVAYIYLNNTHLGTDGSGAAAAGMLWLIIIAVATLLGAIVGAIAGAVRARKRAH
ncbi:MAG: hypothetical protein FJ271_04510 [Planctomycetes bacterium]|nr:hypothetical protein [Planctomycetota bacterium]